MSTEGGGLKGKGLDRLRAQEKSESSLESLDVGVVLINRDAAISNVENAEYVIESAEGEVGKRHFVLKNRKTHATIGKGEGALKDAIERGVWRRKE